jgi:hypothetical protein
MTNFIHPHLMLSLFERVMMPVQCILMQSRNPAPRPIGNARPLAALWRRGHFRRIRFGEGLSESRLGWIKPVLVNAAEAFGPVKTKPYAVR